jgi:hypothetical protein
MIAELRPIRMPPESKAVSEIRGATRALQVLLTQTLPKAREWRLDGSCCFCELSTVRVTIYDGESRCGVLGPFPSPAKV